MNLFAGKRALLQTAQTGAVLFAAAAVLLRPAVAAAGVLRGLELCCRSVIPALFPFLVLSRLLLQSRAARGLGLALRPYTRLLGVQSARAPAAVLCGLLGGFACGARAVDDLYRAGALSAQDAALLLVCAIGAGPGFVVSGVGAQLLGAAGAGWLLLGAQTGASLLCGLAAALWLRARPRAQGDRTPRSPAAFRRPAACCAAGAALRASAAGGRESADARHAEEPTGFVPAVRDAVQACLTLCGYVTIFSFFAAIAVPAGANALVRFAALLPLEVTGACRAACETASAFRTQLCCAALSAMGASVFAQVRALVDRDISLSPLLLSRALHLPLALLLLRALTALFPRALAAEAALDGGLLPAVRMPPDAMLALFVLALLACRTPRAGALRGAQKRV